MVRLPFYLINHVLAGLLGGDIRTDQNRRSSQPLHICLNLHYRFP